MPLKETAVVPLISHVSKDVGWLSIWVEVNLFSPYAFENEHSVTLAVQHVTAPLSTSYLLIVLCEQLFLPF